VPAARAGNDDGFTLIEVLIATGIFVFVAVAGFETVRQLGSVAIQLAQRADAAATANAAYAQFRADAQSSAAVWMPNAPCGVQAVSFLRRNAAGLSFATYVVRANAVVRVSASGPIDPCNVALAGDTVLANVSGMTVTPIPASALPAQADGGLFRPAGIASVAVDTHVRDYDGSTIASGNAIVEVAIDADPARATLDLVAGNRPSGYTLTLTYACGARCQANQATATSGFPELRDLDVTTCSSSPPDLPDTNAFYAAAATGVGAAGRIVVTQYQIRLRYAYTFDGGTAAPVTVDRTGPVFVWPAAANLADAYPVDYTANAVKANLTSIIAAAPPSGLTADDALCTNMTAETDYRG
jgi:prepilin-type N-terminal cleavage/methylation domain-containing protein